MMKSIQTFGIFFALFFLIAVPLQAQKSVPKGNVTLLGLMGRKDVVEHMKKDHGVADETARKIQEILKQALADVRARLAEISKEQRASGIRPSAEIRMRMIQDEGRKIFDAAWAEKAVDLLNDSQRKRLNALRVQQLGLFALADKDVQSALELDKKQIEKLNQLKMDFEKNNRLGGRDILRQLAEAGDDKEKRRKAVSESSRLIEEMKEKMHEDSNAVLSDKQRERLKVLRGKPFEFEKGKRR